MTVRTILDEKGRGVITISPDATLHEAATLMARNRIGALVVTAGEGGIAGILSERDIVRAIGQGGAEALAQQVSHVMTAPVIVCREANTINEVMEIMTQSRFRHLPVEHEGRLDGIVSIGDVVKRRIEDAERESEEIRQYIATA